MCWAVGACSPEQYFHLSSDNNNTAQTIGKFVATPLGGWGQLAEKMFWKN